MSDCPRMTSQPEGTALLAVCRPSRNRPNGRPSGARSVSQSMKATIVPSAQFISEVDANLEMQCTGPTLLTCDRLEEVLQHLMGNVLTEHKALDYRMVIVEPCINARIPYLLFKIFRAVECVNARRVEHGTANSEVHIRSPEIAFQDFRDRTGKTPVSGGVFRVIWSDAQGRPRRIGNRGGVSVQVAVLNRGHRPLEAKVVL